MAGLAAPRPPQTPAEPTPTRSPTRTLPPPSPSPRNAFESVLFLFFEHPYDVGDMVYFNGDSMRVKRISLMYTDFVK